MLYVKLALENDAFDSLFLIYHAYPLEFTAQLKKLTECVLTSLQRSVRFYELKLFFLMKMLHHFSHRQSENALLTITDNVQSSTPANNPLLYTANFINLGCQIFEVSIAIGRKHPILLSKCRSLQENVQL